MIHRTGRQPQRRFQKRIAFAFFLAALVLNCGKTSAMREVGDDEPVKDGPWPDGAVDVANLKSRFRYSTGDGGDAEFLYRGDTAAFQQAVDAFAKVRAPALELVIHEGPYLHWIAKDAKDDGHIDWAYTLYDPEAWHAIYNNPQSSLIRGENKPVPAPRIDVYVVFPAAEGHVAFTQIKMPDGITIKDERAKAPKEKPAGGPIFHGVIYNMANFKTIAGARIEAQQYDAKKSAWQVIANVTADAAGAYRIEKLPPGQYRIVASAKGFAARAIYHQVITPDSSMRLDGELSAEVKVIGTVTDEQDLPLKDVLVRLENPLGIDGRRYDPEKYMEIRTDDAGRFSFTGVATGFAQFECTTPGHQQLHPQTIHRLASWHKISDDHREVSLTGDVRVDLRMALPGTIHCKVTSANEIPIDRNTVNVTVADAEGGHSSGRGWMRFQTAAVIDANGNAEIKDLRPGRYFVTVGIWVDIPETQIVTVNAGKITEVQLVAKMLPKPKQEEPAQPARPPKPPTTDDKF